MNDPMSCSLAGVQKPKTHVNLLKTTWESIQGTARSRLKFYPATFKKENPINIACTTDGTNLRLNYVCDLGLNETINNTITDAGAC